MSKQKNTRPKRQSSANERTVYSEFATERSAATERGIADRPPDQQSLKIHVSRKGRGGKTVTIISGFQHRPDTLKTLSKKLKAQCGTGGTAKEDMIEIQGDHLKTLMDALQKQGYTVKRSGG
jgi:translation initiation factor 1